MKKKLYANITLERTYGRTDKVRHRNKNGRLGRAHTILTFVIIQISIFIDFSICISLTVITNKTQKKGRIKKHKKNIQKTGQKSCPFRGDADISFTKNYYKKDQQNHGTYTSSLTGAHVKRNFCYSTCLRQSISSRAVTNRIIFIQKVCATCYDVPSNISTMVCIGVYAICITVIAVIYIFNY